MIYILQGNPDSPVKIGYTRSGDRKKSLQVGNPQKLKELTTFNGNVALERQIHARLADYQAAGGKEWFHYVGPVKEFVESMQLIEAGYDIGDYYHWPECRFLSLDRYVVVHKHDMSDDANSTRFEGWPGEVVDIQPFPGFDITVRIRDVVWPEEQSDEVLQLEGLLSEDVPCSSNPVPEGWEIDEDGYGQLQRDLIFPAYDLVEAKIETVLRLSVANFRAYGWPNTLYYKWRDTHVTSPETDYAVWDGWSSLDVEMRSLLWQLLDRPTFIKKHVGNDDSWQDDLPLFKKNGNSNGANNGY